MFCGSTEDGKYFFSWSWDIEELQTKKYLQGNGISYHDTLKEAAQDMKRPLRQMKNL